MKCKLISVGGVEDHVHVLVELSTIVSIADLVHGMKGASSHLVTHVIETDGFFKWQGAYGAFTVSASEVNRVKEYIQNQKRHHAQADIREAWESVEIE